MADMRQLDDVLFHEDHVHRPDIQLNLFFHFQVVETVISVNEPFAHGLPCEKRVRVEKPY